MMFDCESTGSMVVPLEPFGDVIRDPNVLARWVGGAAKYMDDPFRNPVHARRSSMIDAAQKRGRFFERSHARYADFRENRDRGVLL